MSTPSTAAGSGGAEAKAFRAGDHVYHGPSGETWLLAWADPATGYLSPCGWPESEARIADCTLIKAASDEEHRKLLRDLKRSGGSRGRKALRLYGDPDGAAAEPAAPHPVPCLVSDFDRTGGGMHSRVDAEEQARLLSAHHPGNTVHAFAAFASFRDGEPLAAPSPGGAVAGDADWAARLAAEIERGRGQLPLGAKDDIAAELRRIEATGYTRGYDAARDAAASPRTETEGGAAAAMADLVDEAAYTLQGMSGDSFSIRHREAYWRAAEVLHRIAFKRPGVEALTKSKVTLTPGTGGTETQGRETREGRDPAGEALETAAMEILSVERSLEARGQTAEAETLRTALDALLGVSPDDPDRPLDADELRLIDRACARLRSGERP